MRNFQQKKGWKNILYSRPVLVSLGILVLFFAWGVVGFMGKMKDTIKNKNIAENKVTQLQQQQTELSANIAKLNTPEGQEASIRDKFGLAKDGEGLVIIVDDKNAPPALIEQSNWFVGFFKRWF